MVKTAQGKHTPHALGAARIGASFFSERCLRLSLYN
jgi:hypothetical protein